MSKVDNHYVNAALNCAQRAGFELAPIMREVGLPKDKLAEKGAFISGEQMTELIQLLWERMDDEFMGCTASPCKRGVFALMSRFVVNFPVLQDVLSRGTHFYNLFTDDIQMELVLAKGEARLTAQFTQPDYDPDGFYQENWLLIWHRFASWITGVKLPLKRVLFPYAKPTHSDALGYLFPSKLSFGHEKLALAFPKEVLELPNIRTHTELSAFLKASPAGLMTIPGGEKRYSARIRAYLLHQNTQKLHCPLFDEIATKFNLTGQTLRRRLHAEGTSYPVIKDQVRYELAKEKLKEKRWSITEIAYQLGFSEPRSFTRAFKKWRGITPSHYLKQCC